MDLELKITMDKIKENLERLKSIEMEENMIKENLKNLDKRKSFLVDEYINPKSPYLIYSLSNKNNDKLNINTNEEKKIHRLLASIHCFGDWDSSWEKSRFHYFDDHSQNNSYEISKQNSHHVLSLDHLIDSNNFSSSTPFYISFRTVTRSGTYTILKNSFQIFQFGHLIPQDEDLAVMVEIDKQLAKIREDYKSFQSNDLHDLIVRSIEVHRFESFNDLKLRQHALQTIIYRLNYDKININIEISKNSVDPSNDHHCLRNLWKKTKLISIV